VAVALIALVLSVTIVAVLLTRQRERHRPEATAENTPGPRKRMTRQEKILQKLDPLPEIPTMMDLVREEIAAEGVDDIPGHDNLPDPIKLKVFRRDQRIIEACEHDGYRFVVADGVNPEDATAEDVALRCDECGEPPPVSDSPVVDTSGTNLDDETLSD
jgi:hypothetical protein